MRLKAMNVLAVTLVLVCASFVCAQQAFDETTLTQMKSTVQKLEALVGDANIPPETREQLNELLFEKRGELHALLRQKRDALRSSLRGKLTARESNAVTSTIRQLDQQMRQLMKASTAVSATGQDAHPQSSDSRIETIVPSNEAAGEAPNEPGNAVAAMPLAAAHAPATTVPLATTTTSATAVLGPRATTNPAAPVVGTQDPACADRPPGIVTPDVEFQRQIRAVVCSIYEAKANVPGSNPSEATLDFRTYAPLMALTIARGQLPTIQKIVVPELTAQAEDASHAKNEGASESSGTSLVAKAGIPAILGFGVENGGLKKTTDGSTMTFTGNPVGLVQAMARKGFISAFQEQDDFTKFLRKFSFGLSFDTSRGTQPGTFTGSRQQLSGFSFKYNIVDQRDPRDVKYTDKWNELTKVQATNLAQSLNFFVIGLATPSPANANFNTWLTNANAALSGKTTVAEIETTLVAELNKLMAVQLPPEQIVVVKQVGTDVEAFLDQRNNILDEISNGWIATFDYNNTRPVGTPSLSNFRFLAEKGAYNGSIDFTGNASVTIYNSKPTGPNAKTLRDFRFAGQLDVPIGDITKTGKFLVSLGGRYQRLLEDEPILGSTLVVPKGDIATFQAKLTIPIRGTAFKIPLSFSYANRTELIKERELRGNFGFTFDLDSIFAKFNPFNKP
ncbi:MAG: hypothetical protein ACRD9S_14910 [Pyrinomonadaceae bacterium]